MYILVVSLVVKNANHSYQSGLEEKKNTKIFNLFVRLKQTNVKCINS